MNKAETAATLERQSFFASRNTIRIEAIREKAKNVARNRRKRPDFRIAEIGPMFSQWKGASSKSKEPEPSPME
jgi:hypothetical protein